MADAFALARALERVRATWADPPSAGTAPLIPPLPRHGRDHFGPRGWCTCHGSCCINYRTGECTCHACAHNRAGQDHAQATAAAVRARLGYGPDRARRLALEQLQAARTTKY
jgi:hypothetical protein